MESKIINGKEYRLVTIRHRSKWVARDGSAYNPIRFNQKATIHYNPDGYACFGGGVPVHLYVAHGWVDGYEDGKEVDHIDYDRCNYHADNLRWVSHKDNVRHSVDDENHYIGVHAGASNGRAVLTTADVAKAKELFNKGYTTSEVIKEFYPHYNATQRKAIWNRFNRIKNKETWHD